MCAKIKYLTPAAKPLCIHICTTVITVVQLSAITFYDLTFLLNIFPKNDQAFTIMSITDIIYHLLATENLSFAFCA